MSFVGRVWWSWIVWQEGIEQFSAVGGGFKVEGIVAEAIQMLEH